MNRRSFFAFLPIAPLALVAEGARAVTADGAPLENAVNLTLMGAEPKNKNELMYLSNGPAQYTFTGFKSDPAKAVSMAVGDDGNLWLKRKDGQWRKVVTE
jgi:hypothetical protein